jgi:small-conductance mechanosensitive channel
MQDLLNRLKAYDLRIAGALIVLLLGYAIYKLASRALHGVAKQGRMHRAMEARLRSIVRVIAFFATVLLAIQQSGAFEHAWAVLSALVTTVAIGFFAIWSVLSNLVCALLILVFKPFRVGDWIEIVEGNVPHPCGVVTDMTLMFVTLEEKAEDGSIVRVQIPNTLVFQKVVRCVPPPELEERESFFG